MSVSFRRSRRSAAKKRESAESHVEFLLNRLYPLECKAPRKRSTIASNVKAATEKLIEYCAKHERKGIAALSLERALDFGDAFLTMRSEEELDRFVEGRIKGHD